MKSKYLKTLFYLFVSIMFIMCITNFSCHTTKEGGKEGWDYDAIVIDSSCSMYIEYHYGNEFFKISTIDSCPKLNKVNYIDGYRKLLNDYSTKLVTHKGIVTFETSFVLPTDTMFTNKLISITNDKFNANSKIIKKEKATFIIDVIPKK